jgi:hypothetical protein
VECTTQEAKGKRNSCQLHKSRRNNYLNNYPTTYFLSFGKLCMLLKYRTSQKIKTFVCSHDFLRH